MRRVEAESSQLGTLWDGCRVAPREQLRHEELPERVEAAPVGLLELDDLVDRAQRFERGAGHTPLGFDEEPSDYLDETTLKRLTRTLEPKMTQAERDERACNNPACPGFRAATCAHLCCAACCPGPCLRHSLA